MRVFVIRHGQRSSSPFEGLSTMGKQQAVLTAKYLDTVPVQEVLTSPTARTQETARIMAEHWGVSVRVEERLASWSAPATRALLHERAAAGIQTCVLVTHLPVIRAFLKEVQTPLSDPACTPWGTLSELPIRETSITQLVWSDGKLELVGAALSEHLTV